MKGAEQRIMVWGDTNIPTDGQNDEDQTGNMSGEVKHDAEAAQDDHWTLERTEEKMIFRYYESADGFTGYQKKTGSIIPMHMFRYMNFRSTGVWKTRSH